MSLRRSPLATFAIVLVAAWAGLALAGALRPRAVGAQVDARAVPGEAEQAPTGVGSGEAAPQAPGTPPADLADAVAPEAAASEAADRPVSLRRLKAGVEETTFGQRLFSFVGLFVLLGVAWLMSTDRRRIPWRVMAWGLGLQLVFGLFVMKTAAGRHIFAALNDVVADLLRFTDEGARFIFGAYLDNEFTFALNVLPTIIFFSSLMTVLYHLGVMQWIVRGFAWIMQRTMGTSGSETLSSAANIFVGQTEAPLVVKPFVETMTRSELMAVMVGGFATVAGGVMAAYVGMLQSVFEDIAGHLIAASVMSAPAALVIAKIMVPEGEVSKTAGSLQLEIERADANVIDAAARGAGDGLRLALNVGAMLLAFLALVAMLNHLLGLPALWQAESVWARLLETLQAGGAPVPPGCADPDGYGAVTACIDRGVAIAGLDSAQFDVWQPLSMQRILGWVFWPVAWVMGVPASEATLVAELLGEKMVLNEFVAYLHLGDMLKQGTELSYRSVVIATYALCGFANFGSIAIQIGGISGIAPNRRQDLARLGLRAMIGGTLAAFMTATVAGMLI